MDTIRILVIEDDPLMMSEIKEAFWGALGYETFGVSTGKAALDYIEQLGADPVVVILDLGLPDIEGDQIAAQISRRSTVGIVVVTARIDRRIKFNLLEIGADAFITKPFDPRELVLTVQAVCRRVFRLEHLVKVTQWRFVPREWMLIAPNGETIGLTVIETQLLDILQRSRGKAVSRLKIGEALGDLHRYSGNALEAIVSRLRRKINLAYPGAAVVKAAPGIGYVLSSDVI